MEVDLINLITILNLHLFWEESLSNLYNVVIFNLVTR